MPYETPEAFRMALEQRLLSHSHATGIGLDRLRRRVIFERILARLQTAEPGVWVLKGGMALEVRLRDKARLSKDIDLGLRDDVTNAGELRKRLIEALGADDPYADRFVFMPGPVKPLVEDGDDQPTWRVKIAAELASRRFGGIQVDVSPRSGGLATTDLVQLPNSLDFAGISVPFIEIIDLHRHAGEKFHGMLKDFGYRDNTRVRDLMDLVILSEHKLLEPSKLAEAVKQVWAERDGIDPPATFPALPTSWPQRYEQLAAEQDLNTTSFSAANAVVAKAWAELFPIEET